MRWKLMVIPLLALCLTVQPAISAENGDAKAGGKKTAKPAKCWKRMPPLEKALMSPEYGTVCKAFEEVLNTTCEPPEKLRCNWTLPVGEKRFKKLKWKPLDPKEYRELSKDILLGKDHSKERWNTTDPEVKRNFEDNKVDIGVVTVDIDHYGRMEHVVSERWRPNDCMAARTFGVMIPETKRLDWRYEHLILNINATDGSEIMLYKNKAYMFGMDTYATPGIVMVYKGFSLFEGTEFGSRDICRFNYIKRRK